MTPIVYRGVEITPNFTSIHGTGAPLKSQRGWNSNLPGYGSLGWDASLAKAKATVDYLRDVDRAPGVARAFAKIDSTN